MTDSQSTSNAPLKSFCPKHQLLQSPPSPSQPKPSSRLKTEARNLVIEMNTDLPASSSRPHAAVSRLRGSAKRTHKNFSDSEEEVDYDPAPIDQTSFMALVDDFFRPLTVEVIFKYVPKI